MVRTSGCVEGTGNFLFYSIQAPLFFLSEKCKHHFIKGKNKNHSTCLFINLSSRFFPFQFQPNKHPLLLCKLIVKTDGKWGRQQSLAVIPEVGLKIPRQSWSSD